MKHAPDLSSRLLLAAAAAALLAGCANMSVGIGLPIGRIGGVGVSVGGDGRVGGSVGVGSGGVAVGVGASGQLPRSSETAASAASAPSP
ncbi:MAG: hypothetical protein Q7U99_09130 [Rubrivivax sp.]|nr:hypothetical protein [Rubrivivax sp.]